MYIYMGPHFFAIKTFLLIEGGGNKMFGIIFILWYVSMGIILAIYNFINYINHFDEMYEKYPSLRIFNMKVMKKLVFICIIIIWLPLLLSNIIDGIFKIKRPWD